MLTRIRDVRKARGLTLDDVARRCDPPTTAQTIGRLETGTRTVSVKWLNRIAAALDVEAGDLVVLANAESAPVAAVIDGQGATAPTRPQHIAPPAMPAGALGLRVLSAFGDYRAGDEIWCERVDPSAFARALNRDVLAPRPGGRFVFGRLIDRQDSTLQILPLEPGQRQVVVQSAPWLAMAVRLIRGL
jgi:transcriptional regulator with XRE-family HTH domain